MVGATGAVGPIVLEVLAERGFPAAEVVAFASARSAGTRVAFAGGQLEVRELTADALEGFDLALFSAGGSHVARYAPEAVARGCVVVDKSSAFRMDADVPLVVPEVNPEAADRPSRHRREPELLDDPAGRGAEAAARRGRAHPRDRGDLSGRVSGTGADAIEELRSQSQMRARRRAGGAVGLPAPDRVQRAAPVRGVRRR